MVIIESKNGILWITLSNPETLNSLQNQDYLEITQAMNKANQDQAIQCILFTSNNKNKSNYFSSGNDFSIVKNLDGQNPMDYLVRSVDITKNFVQSFINCEKYIVAAINGNAYGISFTIMGLVDYIIMDENCFLNTPFSKLGMNVEGCSSFTFPIIMKKLSSSTLILDRRMTAQEAFKCNFVNQLAPSEKVIEEALKICKLVQTVSQGSLKATKRLMKNSNLLQQINKNEMEELVRLLKTEDTMMRLASSFIRPKL